MLNTASLSLITLLDFSPRRLNHPRFNYFNVFGGPSGHLGRQKPSRTQPWHLAGEQNKRGKEQLLFSPERHSGKEVCLHPCRSHQRVFEQIDSRWTPLSTINQQLSLSLSLSPSVSLSLFLSDCAIYELLFVFKVEQIQQSWANFEINFIYFPRSHFRIY